MTTKNLTLIPHSGVIISSLSVVWICVNLNSNTFLALWVCNLRLFILTPHFQWPLHGNGVRALSPSDEIPGSDTWWVQGIMMRLIGIKDMLTLITDCTPHISTSGHHQFHTYKHWYPCTPCPTGLSMLTLSKSFCHFGMSPESSLRYICGSGWDVVCPGDETNLGL